MKLKELAEISQGTVLTRAKASTLDEAVDVTTISMQELKQYLEGGKQENLLVSRIKQKKIQKYSFTKKGDVVVCLTNQKSMVISSDREDALLPSNFALIRILDTNKLDPLYLSWIINESTLMKKQMYSKTQLTQVINVIPLSTIRELEIDTVSIDRQKKIGKLYQLSLLRFGVAKKINKNKKDILEYLINKGAENAK